MASGDSVGEPARAAEEAQGGLRVVFMGSPVFAVPIFDALASHHRVVAAVTQPDRRAGRGRSLRPPAVKTRALEWGVAVLQPTRLKAAETHALLHGLEADVFVVAAYGRILPQAVLDIPRLGSWNVHASLLPAWRGAAPIQWAIINGDPETGVTFMKMEAGLDTGDIAMQRRTFIDEEHTAASLSRTLSLLGAELTIEALDALQDGTLTPTPQDEERVTLAPMLTKEDGHLDFGEPATKVSCRARGVDPWPGPYALLDDKPVKLFLPRLVSAGGTPGEVIGQDEHGLQVACGSGALSFAELQLPGKRRLPARAVVAGRGVALGDRLR